MIDIIGLARTPFSPILGLLSSISPVHLGLKSATKCINNSFINKELIDSVILSQVFPYGQGPSLLKQILTNIGLNNCNNYNVNNLCISGLKAVDLGLNLIKSEKSQVLTEFEVDNMEGRANRYIEDSFEKIASSYSQGVIQNEIAPVNIKALQNGVF
ncbi:conserved hypothetical protein [Theileria orientalis strain Shintoku]|uniref:Thiolase N-terminal domain-containing protein n=1 Tax=Theileria orientalis strain Shintoku TaxID=869250 RepID=J4D5J4_THEOR|nr:conserved hypothetical protein [Theileria orientalis strain Shintoku]BAM39005.1 conserved hypothetical protein [Theileria orientalis strain Shintoku]|eukprot:XP_009689306.1 conserved hypothetical protein [Theileria orientalis strain Shintoku]